MNAPRLSTFQSSDADLLSLPAFWRSSGSEVFVVTQAGEFAGVRYGAGDVLLCRGDSMDGEPVVLVARGHGRPRLGWTREDELFGDMGEPCSAARWRACGRVAAVMRATASSLALVRGPTARRRSERGQVRGPVALAERDQLSLFTSAA